MNCKYCNAELEEGQKVCPACGETVEQAEPTVPAEEVPAAPAVATAAAAPVSVWAIILATAACVLLMVILVVAVIYGITGKLPYISDLGETTAPTETVGTTVPAEPTDLGMEIEGLTENATYTGDEAAVKAAMDTVVATVGEHTLTNGELQVYYWMEFYNFVEDNSSYLSSYGLDYTQPMDTQYVLDTDVTWQQFFLDGALQTWHRYVVLNMLADEAGYELSEADEAELEKLPEAMNELAVNNGYADGVQMLVNDMGPGCTMDSYLSYMRVYRRGMAYFSSLYENTQPTDEQIEAFFAEYEADYEASGVTKDAGNFVNVRHILLTPEGGTEDEEGVTTYTDEAWEACRVAAQAVLDQWLAGEANEATFGELANEHSTDPGSNTVGGLYENVYEGQMVTEFNDWCFDETRQYGDYGLVKTSFGYHVMYFVKSVPIWYYYASNELVSEMCTTYLTDGVEANPVSVELSGISLGLANLSTGEETTEGTEATGTTEATAATEAAQATVAQ